MKMLDKSFKFMLILLFLLMPRFSLAEQKIVLSVSKVKRLVLAQSLGVKQLALDAAIAKTSLPELKGMFDTNLKLSASHQVDKFRRNSTFFGDRTDTTAWGASLNKKFLSGTLAALSFDNIRQKTFGSTIIANTPLYEPAFGLTLEQPLLKNFFGTNDRDRLKSTRLAYEASDLATKRQIQSLMNQSLNHFWSFVLAKKNLQARQRSVEEARRFSKITAEKNKLGTVEQTDVLAVRANVLTRESEKLNAASEVEQAVENLRASLSLQFDVELQSKVVPSLISANNASVEQKIAAALERRTDYLSAHKVLKREGVELAMAKNSRLPQIDLLGSYELNEIDSDYASSLGADNPKWTVGLNLSLPLENRSARAIYNRSKQKKLQALYALKELEVKIGNELNRIVQELKLRRKTVKKLAQAESLEREKLFQELKKYRRGRSSAENIIRFQDDLVLAEQRSIKAWQQYYKSLLEFELASGTIVDEEVK